MQRLNSRYLYNTGAESGCYKQTQADDSTLLGQIAAGDATALGILYDRYRRLVFNVALRITGDHGDAEEMTQDTFLRLWERAAHYHPERGSFVAWLWTIVHRRSIDELRSRRHSMKRREVHLDDMLASQAVPDHAGFIHLCIDLQAALAELPAIQREVIEQTILVGLSRQELARRTGSPVATIHTRWRKGIQRLRTMLGSTEYMFDTRPDPTNPQNRLKNRVRHFM